MKTPLNASMTGDKTPLSKGLQHPLLPGQSTPTNQKPANEPEVGPGIGIDQVLNGEIANSGKLMAMFS